MIVTRTKRVAALVVILLCLCTCPGILGYGAVDASLLASLSSFPGVKAFDFTADPVRENVSASTMVGPEYSIKLTKEFPDEYFGVQTSQLRDGDSGETVTGLFMQRDGGTAAKGNCGCIYRNMFQYKGQWVDVKTTYVDWLCQVKKVAFMCGGFANCRWQALWYLEMKHEFFLAGTDTPVNVKGYLEYADMDNSQGMLLKPGEYDGIWVNSSETIIGYRNIQTNTDIVHNRTIVHQLDHDMLCIQSMTNDDYPAEGESNYNRQVAAKGTFAYTFSGSVIHTGIIDDDASGINIMNSSSKKHVPSALPQPGTADVAKKVSDQDETDVALNHVRSWQQWTYRIKAIVPLETEQGNMYDGFTISDSIDPGLIIQEVKVKRVDEDVSELFEISTEDNVVTVEAANITDPSFYGCTYILEITVKTRETKEELTEQNLLNENLEKDYSNVALVTYTDGKGENEIETNLTSTIVQFERESDIAITKTIRNEDRYAEHGDEVFIFRLYGVTASGQEKEYNRAVTMDSNTETVWFRNIPEGEYSCSEYDTFRFCPASITNVTGGRANGDTVDFTTGGEQTCSATFINIRKSWENYSDSSLKVNRIGLGNN
ncbi:MAG: isopeptide-forming domain-containing fimbrial protein [Clostridia bacterium]|nr:isopeptide-forming domain-containing fimbrial protein [Clostridia bacterium]